MSSFGKPKSKPKEKSEIIFTPKDFQTEAIKYLLQNPEAGLFLGTGLGKTIVFLIAFYLLKKQGLVSKALVIAKRRIIHNVWPKEVEKWDLPFKVVKVHGNEQQRLKALATPADIYLLTYQGIDWISRTANHYQKDSEGERVLLHKAIPKELRWWHEPGSVLCLDESSMVKNWNTARSRRLRTMLKHFDRRHILTASPRPKGMEDVFMQTYVLDMGSALGMTLGGFRNSYFEPVPREERGRKWDDYQLADDGEERIYKALQELVIHFPKDVLKLPPLHIIERPVQLSPESRAIYRDLEEDYVAHLEGGTITAANAGVATQKLRQLAGGAVYNTVSSFDRHSIDKKSGLKFIPADVYDDSKAKHRRQEWLHVHDEKIDELRELIEELQGEPLLIAYEFDHERQRIQAAFDESMPHIGGGTSDAEADELIEKWNNGELPNLLGHPDSIAHGLNLQESGWNICFFGIGWNLENHTQFIDRVYRQGQEHAVWVYLLVAEDTIDEAVISVLKDKEADQARLLQAVQAHVIRNQDMHKWKEVKLPKKLLDSRDVVDAFLARHDAKWIPTWDPNLDDAAAAFGLASSIMVALGGWVPGVHASFQNEVLRTKIYKEMDNISLLFRRTQAIIFTCLRLSTVDAEAPVTQKGKLGHARIYISTAPEVTKTCWPVQATKEDLKMAKATANKITGKKTAAKKVPAKNKRAAVGGGVRLAEATQVKVLKKPADVKLRGLRETMFVGVCKIKNPTYGKLAAFIQKQTSENGKKQTASGWVRWMERTGLIKLTAVK